MTSQEQAKATAYAQQLLHELNIGDCVGEGTRADDLAITVRHFAQALDAARRETWEAAAALMEEECTVDWLAITRITNCFKQQAAAPADKEA